MALLCRNARLIDPQVGLDEVCDLLVDGKRIEKVGHDIDPTGAEVRDLMGKVIIPGLVDMHVHLREPGLEYKETIETGTRAAVIGGFTGVAPMANTRPVCDTGSRVRFIVEEAEARGHCRVHPIGAVTRGLEGKELAEIGDMLAHGAVAFSDDGHGVQDNGVMRRGMDYIKMFGRTILSHCQLEDLVGKGVVNEGVVSTRLGMAGWPAAGEEMQIARDIALCELTGCALHIQHLTTARGVELVWDAKERGLPVTCEVTPHHLFLCEDDITDAYDTNLKMNPPLRPREDMLALQQAVCEGKVDCIATDHAPHAAHEKMLEFELAPFGTTGLETALSLMLTELVIPGRLSYGQLVELMAVHPREILHLPAVKLEPGCDADLTIIDPEVSFTVTEDFLGSRSHNNAFLGRDLTGRASDVYVGGNPVLVSGQVV
ncbi:MAG: dihydroorotase [Actinomycetota bacterium]|nr:dihydroorotase [Actinomycetota bacterium]